MYIANIIFLDKNSNFLTNLREERLFKHIKFSDDYTKVNKTLPTLFVGYKNTLEIYSDLDILEYRVDKYSSWCFSPEESIHKFLSSIMYFIKQIPTYISKNIDSVVLDMFFNDKCKSIEGIINNVLIKEKVLMSYYLNNSVYCLTDNNKTLIIDLGLYNYFDNDTKLLLEYLKANSVKYYDDSDKKIYKFFKTLLPEMEEKLVVAIPYLISLKNG